jgi:predicted outer membrane lipoprotein
MTARVRPAHQARKCGRGSLCPMNTPRATRRHSTRLVQRPHRRGTLTPDQPPTGLRLALHRAGLYLGLINATRVDDDLTYRQRLRVNWRRQLRASWPEALSFLIVVIIAGVARWYITVLVAVGLGAAFAAFGALWQNHGHQRDAPAETPPT